MMETSPLDGTFQVVQSITLKRLIPEVGEMLVQHGCTLDNKGYEVTLVTFPESTHRQEIWPRTMSERYRIMLPDGQELRQVFDRIQDISQLFIVLDENVM